MPGPSGFDRIGRIDWTDRINLLHLRGDQGNPQGLAPEHQDHLTAGVQEGLSVRNKEVAQVAGGIVSFCSVSEQRGEGDNGA